ncbi:MAG: type I restriction-modification system subunit M [Flavobacteriales bacterium]|nr:type I restriction-modification system subunit M [Flavobacteriales bacterium]
MPVGRKAKGQEPEGSRNTGLDTAQDEQTFLKELDKKLWTAADRLRSSLDAAVYKHAVLGLIFLKYVSDSFELRQQEVEKMLKDPKSDFYTDPKDFRTGGRSSAQAEQAYSDAIRVELEVRDYYTQQNVFWVPPLARWKTIQDSAKLPSGSTIPVASPHGATYKMSSLGKLIDDALEAIERENPKLKNVLNKTYTQLQLDPANLGSLIDLIATIPFVHGSLHAKDILGHVYEYFLGQFALAEGKKGGQYYTPKSIVSLIVRMLQPYKGRVYDPAMGSGGFFVQSEEFIEQFGGRLGDISVYGQESNPTTWRLAAMNMAIRGIDFNFGKEPANSFTNDQHPALRADFVMANPPFNVKEWWDARLEGDARWAYGTPPAGNANFAWLQHMLHHLAPKGSMALLLANGSMSSNTGGEGEIRRKLVEADLVECMVALPGQLFTNTQIPACIWFLSKDKHSANNKQDRRRQVLFIDARSLGFMKDRVLRDFSAEDLERIVGTYHLWKYHRGTMYLGGQPVPDPHADVKYENIPGFAYSAALEEIAKHDFVLTPGRYVGAGDGDSDDEGTHERIDKLRTQLFSQFEEEASLVKRIKQQLESLAQ